MSEPPASRSPSRKRSADELESSDALAEPSQAPQSAGTLLTQPISYSNPSSPSNPPNNAERAASPSSGSSLTSISGDHLAEHPSNDAVPGAVPQKRRKLTPAEKLQRQQEKEVKAKERAEAKAKRDEEKRVEDEEKQRKRAEREEKKRQKEYEDQQKKQERDLAKQERDLAKQEKDLAKQEKDLAKQKEEEEKQKKERSQMRLNAFFTKPKTSPASKATDPTELSSRTPEASPCKSRPSDSTTPPVVPLTGLSPRKSTLSDYERRFLPFCPPANVVMAPQNYFRHTAREAETARTSIEQTLQSSLSTMQLRANIASSMEEDELLGRWEHAFSNLTVQEILSRLHGTSSEPIDLTKNGSARTIDTPMRLLKSTPLKYIHFEQDVRPAYYGTYTRAVPTSTAKHLARDAWSRTLPSTDYDYDSEVEWEEPEEGEDILSDGEEDGDSVEGEDDMEGFLDDENDSPRKRRPVVTTELEPDSSGLCWEDDQKQMRRADDSDECPNFHGFRMGILLANAPATINPFSTAYWEKETKTTPATPATAAANHGDGASMQPPARAPLQPRPNGGNSKIMEEFTGKAAVTQVNVLPVKRGPKPKTDGAGKIKRMVPLEQLEDFKRVVDGSDMTKIALIEDLKKKFPKLPKDAINNTLSTVAARVGAKEVEKRWVLL